MTRNLSSFFIDRPIFASVIALFITLLGAFAYPLLPLAQYPEIAPPSVAVTAAFPGASAETMAETIAAPIEQEINGAEGMLYGSYDIERTGGVGMFGGSTQQSFLRSRANSIEGGTTEVMKNILGERVLGLPKEVRADRQALKAGK